MMIVKLKLLYYVIVVATCVKIVIVYCIVTSILIPVASDKTSTSIQMFKEEENGSS